MPLLDPLPPETTPELAKMADYFAETLGFFPNSLLTMQRRPEIAFAVSALNRAVMAEGGRVTAEQKRLIAYLASTTAGCLYCQAHTSVAAARHGGEMHRVADVWSFETSERFSEAERAAFRFAIAAASSPSAVDETISEGLRAHWDEGEIVEIAGVVALFGFLNRWNDSMGTPLEEVAVEEAGHLIGERGWAPGKHG